MKVTLISMKETIPVSRVENYKKLGFDVNEHGFISKREIEFDTNLTAGFIGISKRPMLQKLREATGCAVVVNGIYWQILNNI